MAGLMKGDDPSPDARRPQRYRLYDRFAGRVSVGAMNIVIIVVAALLVIALAYGIATGTPGERP